MATPAILLTLLLAPWVAARLAGAAPGSRAAAARWGLTAVFAFTAVGHFVQTEAMAAMIPPFVPWRREIVLASGVLEIALAVALAVPRLRRPAGWAAVALLLGFLPINVWAAWNRVPMGGHAWGPAYLLVRVPLQLVLLAWTVRWFLRQEPLAAAQRPAE